MNMSPITPAPTVSPGEAPAACQNLQNIKGATDVAEATPSEPTMDIGRVMRNTIFRPSVIIRQIRIVGEGKRHTIP
jgi:hypothetical protein